MATRVLIVGDALSRGSARQADGTLPDPVRPSWRYWLWRALREKGRDVDFIGPQTYPDFEGFEFDQDNCCYGGKTTTAWMAAKVRSVAGSGLAAPDIALILLGTEDAYDQVAIATRVENMKAIVTDLRAWRGSGLKVVIAQLPKTTDGANGTYRDQKQIAPYNTALVAMANQLTTATEPVLTVDCHTGWTAAMSDETGRKPSEAGERFIAERFFAALDPLLGGVSAEPPVAEPDDGDPNTPPPADPDYNAGTVRAEFAASRLEGSYPLAVTFTDRSVADRKRIRRTVLTLDGIDAEYARKLRLMAPDYMFALVPDTPVEGTNWSLQAMATGDGSITLPWPVYAETVVVSKRERDGASWGTTSGATLGTRTSVAVTADERAAGDYEAPGRLLLQELLRTVPGLEDVGAMRTSTGFRAWLADRGDGAATFLANPATAPLTDEILGLWTTYLVELYWTDPDLHSGQVSYAWTFGDGDTSALRNPSHTFAAAGAFVVTLTVTTPYGTAVATQTVTVVEPTAPPVANFRVSSTAGEAPFGVQFTDASTGGAATSYLWEFGDGRTSTAANPAHVYVGAGVYSPALTVTNGGGSDTATMPYLITVNRAPAPVPPIHELTRAGYLDLLDMLGEGFAWIELRDGAGLPVAARVDATGRVTWTVDPETVQARIVVRVNATDAPALPFQLSGVAFYESETGGTPLAVARFAGALEGWPRVALAADTLDVAVHVTIVADSLVPRIEALTVMNVSGDLGTAMILWFRVVNVQPGWTVVLDEVSPVVVDGGRARLSVRVVKD